MRELGINSVRLPFGFWIVAPNESAAAPYYRGRGLEHIDEAMRWAEEQGIDELKDEHIPQWRASSSYHEFRRARPPPPPASPPSWRHVREAASKAEAAGSASTPLATASVIIPSISK